MNPPTSNRGSANRSPSTDDSGALTIDLNCVQCGYNLRGLHIDLACPECGQAIAAAIELYQLRAESKWLGILTVGATAGLISMLSSAFCLLILVLVATTDGASGGLPGSLVTIAIALAGLSVWCLTVPLPNRDVERLPALRLAARYVGLVFLASTILVPMVFDLLALTLLDLPWLWLSCWFTGAVLLAGLYLRHLAVRLNHPGLGIIAIGWSLSVVVATWPLPLAQLPVSIAPSAVVLMCTFQVVCVLGGPLLMAAFLRLFSQHVAR
ncbi:MAG: hypothetical protein WD042_03675 [Phycisphaeraceae bacterium]